MFNSSESFTHDYSEDLVNEPNIIYIEPSNCMHSFVELDDVKTAIKELPTIAKNSYDSVKDKILTLLGGEGRSACSLKRKKYISESTILKIGLSDFVPTREHYRESDKETKFSDYLSTAKQSLRIMSVSLYDGIKYHGTIPVLDEILKKIKT